jgi:uncharacterized repeat protein (TIGR03806 family)
MMPDSLFPKIVCWFVACVLLASCGGGGSDSTLVGEGPVLPQRSGLLMRPDNVTCIAPPRPSNDAKIVLTDLLEWGDLSRRRPVGMFLIPGSVHRWMAMSQFGVISEVESSGDYAIVGTVLDMTDIVTTNFQGRDAEFGALGLAIHPEFESVPIAYLTYTVQTGPDAYELRLSSFQSDNSGRTLSRGSEQILLTLPLVSGVHVSGHLAFGPDGYLYLGVGDGGIADRAQAPFELFGKILRLGVDDGDDYWIPDDNPFVDGTVAPEIWALGLRNPWQFSFDEATGDLWVGDVGLNDWEEVDQVVKGGNYGWPFFEGPECRVAECPSTGLDAPIAAYSHQGGSAAIVGGFVYKGDLIPELRGVYVFMDLVLGQIWALYFDEEGNATPKIILETDAAWATYAMGQGSDGEIYVLHKDFLRRMESAGSNTPKVEFPPTLSATGCMDSSDPRQPGSGLIPYEVNSELWSDGAVKQRWMALPNGSQIKVNGSGDWELPNGSVLVKNFELAHRLIETRLFVRHEDGAWGGYSYEWNESETEAHLLPGAKTRTIGDVIWRYPSRNQCMQCHTDVAGGSLGLETAQLNGELVYPTTGNQANQLSTLASIGVLPTTGSDPDKLVSPWDETADINARARSYLHANCSFCHRPEGPGQGPEDFRFHLANGDIGAVDVLPTQGDFGIPNARLIIPGDPDRSLLLHRLETLEKGRMPPLASGVVHAEAVELIRGWINDTSHFD